ncbi:PilT/PilU family type 4a pilus ATPase [Heliobacterium gestii]|uniref:PilT/PilU family type 4a pilus ATPase n=1 Tax=Heliomicrobium gestii TaxID=2699 RepID=A0A845LAR9_HELGE|nr:type IV pilus twitching motility protein PilT [Heliomicrobium gestii]MBM7867890.1 twitching motility protein PilT [Heliomicrobium gestii]MZP43298.1 PilT/PilU family type 4a pilus ATPase [Heliomicrobium gestii]
MQINDILALAAAKGASDVHLTVGRMPSFRINGKLTLLQELGAPIDSGWLRPLMPPDTDALVRQVLNEKQLAQFEQKGEADLSYAVPTIGRFRVNVFRQRGSAAMVLRIIPLKPPSFRELGLPEVLANLARRPNGLVLVTGPTGSGKSTTLAAMIDLINEERAEHIITLEDPIEFLHRHNKSIVNQREIGLDSTSFAGAVRAAMREDPDVILVGEMRDLETIATAITAAETGHLVMATLHTNDVSQTIDRIIDVFDVGQQAQIRIQLATVLQGVVCQQLLPRADGKGRVVAQEIMVCTTAIRNLIREGKTHQIATAIQTGGKLGMQTMHMALKHLVTKGLVSREEAVKKSADPDALMRYMMDMY